MTIKILVLTIPVNSIFVKHLQASVLYRLSVYLSAKAFLNYFFKMNNTPLSPKTGTCYSLTFFLQVTK